MSKANHTQIRVAIIDSGIDASHSGVGDVAGGDSDSSVQKIRLLLREKTIREIPKNENTSQVSRPTSQNVSQADYSWIKKAALYPYNKEMHSLVRYREMLDFEIVGVGDPLGKGMGNREKHIRTAYGRSLITPKKMARYEIDRHLQALEDAFQLPAIEILSERGQQRLVDTVIQYFSADQAAMA